MSFIEHKAPFLSKLTAASWASFLTEYETYAARGGIQPLTNLISAATTRIIRLKAPESAQMDPQEFVEAVSAFFAPPSALESFDNFTKIKMPNSAFSMDALLEYVMAYDKMEVICARVLPPVPRLIKTFIAALRPSRVGERVRFREPETLAEAKAYAVEELEQLLHMSQEVAMAAPATVRVQGPSSNDRSRLASTGAHPSRHNFTNRNHSQPSLRGRDSAASAPRLPASDSAAAADVCHGCGHSGHRRPDCPHKNVAGWFRTGKRLKRLEISSSPSTTAGSTHQAKPVSESHDSAAAARVPRIGVTLVADNGEQLCLSALIDTGASLSFLSPAVYEELLRAGVRVRRVSREVVTAGEGKAMVDTEVTCIVKTEGVGGREVEMSVTFGVMPTGEDVLLGYGDLVSCGLLSSWGVSTSSDNAATASTYDEMPAGTEIVDVVEQRLAPEVAKLVAEFADVFVDTLPVAGARVDPMPLQLKPDCSPTPISPRRASPAIRQVIKQEVESLLEQAIIRPSLSPYSSPVVVVKKRDGSYRMCVDYRAVNACSVDMKYPMQNTKAVLERMVGKRVFGVMDLRSGFHQIPLEESAIPLTAFSTTDGLFEYVRVPFGLKNAPPFFQQTMSTVLSGLVGNVCEVFVDDIIVHGEDDADFLRNLRSVLLRLRAYDFRVKLSKCRLGLGAVEYLGHIVDGQGIRLSSARKQGLKDIKAPASTAQVRSFMGLANYFRAFVPNFACISKPLTRLCSPRVPFRWTDQTQHAFDTIKKAVLEAPLLHHLDYELPIVLRTDASTEGIGAVLLQQVDGAEHPVCFVSKAFTPAESRWSTIEQEAYAIYYSILTLSHHLLGHAFVVETDHRNLLYLERATAPKLVRWRLRLQEYNFTVRHVPGKHNCVADALSRCLFIDVASEPSQPSLASVLPHAAEIAVVHNAVVGHRGVKRTMELLQEQGNDWPTIRNDVSRFITSCPTCQKVRLGQGSVAGALKTITVSEPFEMLAIDTIGPLPVDESGNAFIIVAIDCFSRFVELRAAPSTEAQEAAKLLLDIFGRYGAPKKLRSDRGSQFTAKVIDHFLRLCGVTQELTLPYRPQANGICERTNGEVTRHLRALVMDLRAKDNWSVLLPLVQRILNATPHSAIGMSPSRLLFGGAVTSDRSVLVNLEESSRASARRYVAEDYVQELISAQRDLLVAAQKHQDEIISERMQSSPEHPTTFEEGQYVLVSYHERPPNKLSPRWRGPMVIKEVDGNTYVCQDLRTLQNLPFDISRLKLYHMEQTTDAMAIAAVDQDEWEVDHIVEHRGPVDSSARTDLEFRVRWKGFGEEDDCWLPYLEVNQLEALDVYAAAHPELRL